MKFALKTGGFLRTGIHPLCLNPAEKKSPLFHLKLIPSLHDLYTFSDFSRLSSKSRNASASVHQIAMQNMPANPAGMTFLHIFAISLLFQLLQNTWTSGHPVFARTYNQDALQNMQIKRHKLAPTETVQKCPNLLTTGSNFCT